MIKVVVILFILIGMAYAASQMFEIIETEDGQFQLAVDSAMKQAIEKGEFQFPGNIIPIESKDCEGTQWIKQQECSLNGKSMDGTEGSCGPGKEIWILDQTHSDFKPATGDGKCEPQERDCSVECPKPCEGDTWKDTGKCVRKEYDTRGNMKKIVLDGTEGKCGEGITELKLDTTAPDYKPAVGKGKCPMTKGGACNVPCPKPEPPKCNNYTGWVENVGLGCVINEFSTRKVQCGKKGVKQSFNVSTNPQNCEELVKWEDCWGEPCPIDCVGSWSGWSAPKSDEPCGVQPYKEKTYTVTTQAQHRGRPCDYTHGDTRKQNAGSVTPCCEETNDWAVVPGSCNSRGLAIYTQAVTENKPGGCPDSAKSKKMACCYQAGDWWDITRCNSIGKKTQQQTTAGNCAPSVKTRDVNCEYVSGWSKTGGCGTDGKQWYSRTTVNSNKSTREWRHCPVNCEGYYEDPACPSTCSKPGHHISKRWITTRSPLNGGKACPGPGRKWCGTTPACPPCKWTHRKDWTRDHRSPMCHHTGSRRYGQLCWNDHMSSYKLGEGCENWTMKAYEHNYSGRHFVMKPGVNAYGTGHDVPPGWNHLVTSVKAELKPR